MLCVDKQRRRRVFETFHAEPYGGVVLHIQDILQLAYHVLHAERVESSIGEMAKRGRDDAVLPSVYL